MNNSYVFQMFEQKGIAFKLTETNAFQQFSDFKGQHTASTKNLEKQKIVGRYE